MRIEIFLLLLVAVLQTYGQFQKDRVCSSSRHIDDCNQLQRGNSEVNCVYAQDAVECAYRIRNGTADFGMFTAESAFHIASLGWDDLTVIKEVRHNTRLDERFDFQSVVIVRSDHIGGVKNLLGVDYCHPGLNYERHSRWTERFLKHFERSIVKEECNSDQQSPAEQEVAGLAKLFNAACRPGSWSNNEREDKILKEKYPKLCSLCDDVTNCAYVESEPSTSHRLALECVRKSGNAITYVALQEAQDFFEINSNLVNQFSFLCPNGSMQEISNNPRPCVWLSQPWKVILSNNQRAISLSQTLGRWINSNTGWEDSLRQILIPDSTSLVAVNNIVRLPDYMRPLRTVPLPSEDSCIPSIRWCTHSSEEKEKCDVLKAVALTTGIVPQIICNYPKSSPASCISDVSTGKADFVGIDSNYGYIARHPYNLTGALFEETETNKYSSVVAIIKEKDAEKIKRFEDFKGKRACFGEFGGIASIAFINVAKNRGIFKRADCDFGQLLGGYFGDSCFPGSRNIFHDLSGMNPDSMCTLCQTQAIESTTAMPLRPMADRIDGEDEPEAGEIEGSDNDDTNFVRFIPNRAIDCEASQQNRFYGTRGALACLNEVGEIAVVEHQNLIQHAEALKLDPNDFRILCKNGSLAANTGFDVDAECVLTTIVDGEIVIHRKSNKTAGVINVLLSLDKYLQNDPDFKMYNIFNGEKNLLFEDSSIGLVAPQDNNLGSSVQNYIKLFEDVENCIEETGGAQSIAINFFLTFSLVLFTILIRN